MDGLAPFEELTKKGVLMELKLGSVVVLKSRLPEGVMLFLRGEIRRLWPIVKYAILTGPFALLADSGGRLLDLPGLQDENEGQNAVVEAFLTKCTGFFIAAPIKSQGLVGRQFRRQLFMDGRMGSVAFAAMQTDNLEAFKILSELGLAGVASYADLPGEEILAAIQQHKPAIKKLRGLVSDINTPGAELRSLTIEANKLSANLDRVTAAMLKLAILLREHEHVINHYCALARNAFARIQLPQDFTDGIREIMEASLTRTEIDLHLLPVFTVSARDYKVLYNNRAQEATAFFSWNRPAFPASTITYLTLGKRATPEQQRVLSRSVHGLNLNIAMQLTAAIDCTRTRLQSLICACAKRYREYTLATAGYLNLNNSLAAPMMETSLITWRDIFGTGVAKVLTKTGVRRGFELCLANMLQTVERDIDLTQRESWRLVSRSIQTLLGHGYDMGGNEKALIQMLSKFAADVKIMVRQYAAELLRSVEIVWDADCDLDNHECDRLVQSVGALKEFISKESAALFALKSAIAKINFDEIGSKFSALPRIDEVFSAIGDNGAAQQLVDLNQIGDVLFPPRNPPSIYQ
ncbi:hypothetical protein BDR26DRAFT_985086 [Obelidium mucronatum]|nr:hypothetical protein BDR26DRAFT_985086 [Obelidium mucronatum]